MIEILRIIHKYDLIIAKKLKKWLKTIIGVN